MTVAVITCDLCLYLDTNKCLLLKISNVTFLICSLLAAVIPVQDVWVDFMLHCLWGKMFLRELFSFVVLDVAYGEVCGQQNI